MMISEILDRLVASGMAVVFSIAVPIIGHFLIMAEFRSTDKWKQGKDFGRMLHKMVIVLMIGLAGILLVYVGLSQNRDFRGIAGGMGAGVLSVMPLTYALVARSLPPDLSKYIRLVTSGLCAAVTSYIVFAAGWVIGTDNLDWLAWTLSGYSFGMLILAEALFLVRNRWKWLPSHPR